MTTSKLGLATNVINYLQEFGVRESLLKQALRAETAQLKEAEMQISPEQGQFMALLVHLMQAKHIIEIGTFTGYSTLCLAEALPADGEIIACDTNDGWTSIARRYWAQAGVDKKIKLKIDLAINTLENLLQTGKANSFDLIFIDADKQSYPIYFEKSLALLRQGGLMLVDNVLRHGKVADLTVTDPTTRAIRRFNEALITDPRIELSMISLGDGMTLALKR